MTVAGPPLATARPGHDIVGRPDLVVVPATGTVTTSPPVVPQAGVMLEYRVTVGGHAVAQLVEILGPVQSDTGGVQLDQAWPAVGSPDIRVLGQPPDRRAAVQQPAVDDRDFGKRRAGKLKQNQEGTPVKTSRQVQAGATGTSRPAPEKPAALADPGLSSPGRAPPCSRGLHSAPGTRSRNPQTPAGARSRPRYPVRCSAWPPSCARFRTFPGHRCP